MLVEKEFNTGTLKLNYAEGPKAGPPLVLLHAGASRWQEFLPLLPQLTLRYQVYAFDLRGYGKSGCHPRPNHYRLTEASADIAAFLASLNEKAILFGHSLGGYISMWLSAQHPDLVAAVIVGDSIVSRDNLLKITRDTRPRWEENAKLVGECSSVTELATRLYKRASPTNPNFDMTVARFTAQSLKQADNLLDIFSEDYYEGYDPAAFLGLIKCPMLFLQADPEKGGVSDKEVEMVGSLVNNFTTVQLKGLGHGLHMEQAEPVLKALTNFLESLD